MARSTGFNLDLPDDFPVADLEALHAHVSQEQRRERSVDAWVEWAGASNGVVCRYRACDEHAGELAASLDESVAPPEPERYRQERLLFSVFTEGLSCVECLYYGLYFVGAMADPAAFDADVDPRAVTTKRVVLAYEQRFAGEDLTGVLASVHADAETESWRVRAQPPRPSRLPRPGVLQGRRAIRRG